MYKVLSKYLKSLYKVCTDITILLKAELFSKHSKRLNRKPFLYMLPIQIYSPRITDKIKVFVDALHI